MINNKYFFSFIIFIITSPLFSGQWLLNDHTDVIDKGYLRRLNFEKLYAFDSLNIIAIANTENQESVIKKTSDGGKSWHISLWDSSNKYMMYAPNIYSGCYYNSGLSIVCGDSGYYYKSTDYCISWNKFKLDHESNRLVLINMHDSNTGYMMTYRSIYKTEDTGATWKRLNLKISDTLSGYYIYGLSVINKDFIYSILYDPIRDTTMLLGYNTKNDSAVIKITYKYNCSNLIFSDSLHGFLTASVQQKELSSIFGSAIIKTTDAGDNWTTMLDTLPLVTYGLGNITFLDSKNAIAYAYSNLWITTDGGNKWNFWNIKKEISTSLIKDILQVSPDIFYAVDTQNNIWKYSDETGVSEPQNQEPFSIFPNPAQTIISMILPEEYQSGKIEIYSLEGILIQEIQNTNKIDVSSLCAGVYFVKVRDKFMKFIKW